MKAKTVDAYIAAHPPAVRKRLEVIRAIVLRVARGAEEKISYGIPAYLLDGRLVYFAAHTEHIGVYPITALVRKELAADLKSYVSASAKSTVRLPHDRPIPRALVARIVRARLAENRERAAKKRAR